MLKNPMAWGVWLVCGIAGSYLVVESKKKAKPESHIAVSPLQLPTPNENKILEPSGIAWSSKLNEFIFVSDNVQGRLRKDTPLYGLNLQGEVRSHLLKIAHGQKFDDLEAIAAGEENEFFVLSSQNSEQTRKSQILGRIEVGETGLEMKDSVHFLDLLRANLSEKDWMDLGIQHSSVLEIESMAYADESLYFALKRPNLNPNVGVIWKLTDVRNFFKTRTLDKDQLHVWKKVNLPITAGHFTDLVVLGENFFALTNSPKAQTSFLWKFSKSQEGEPKLLETFKALKAEGLAFTPDQKELVVVFDQDSKPGKWTKIPNIN